MKNGFGETNTLFYDKIHFAVEEKYPTREETDRKKPGVGWARQRGRHMGRGVGGEERGGENMVCSGNTVGNIRTAPRNKMPASLGKNLNCQHMYLCSEKYTPFFSPQDESPFQHQ